MRAASAGGKHLLVRWRCADLDAVADVVRFRMAVGVESIGGSRADIIGVVSGMCGEGSSGNLDCVGEGLRVGEVGSWKDGVEDCGLHGDVEGVPGGNPVHDFKWGNPPK